MKYVVTVTCVIEDGDDLLVDRLAAALAARAGIWGEATVDVSVLDA